MSRGVIHVINFKCATAIKLSALFYFLSYFLYENGQGKIGKTQDGVKGESKRCTSGSGTDCQGGVCVSYTNPPNASWILTNLSSQQSHLLFYLKTNLKKKE